MPTYEYECESCHRVFEAKQRISAPPLTTCDACGGPVHRLLSPAPFILKGDGWYVTDYPSEARKKAREAEKKPAETKSSGTETKSSEPKSDTKATTTSGTPSAPSSTAG